MGCIPICDRTVSTTLDPNNNAPRNYANQPHSPIPKGEKGWFVATSQKVAIRAAWRRVKLRELTDVEKEFATSLAPILNASANAKTMPSAKMYVYCGSAGIRNEPSPV